MGQALSLGAARVGAPAADCVLAGETDTSATGIPWNANIRVTKSRRRESAETITDGGTFINRRFHKFPGEYQ